jgi:ribosome-associated protein
MTTPGEAFIRPEQCRHQRVCYNKNINRLWEDRLLEDLELAHKIVDVLSEKQAADILLLDTHEVCSFADYFVIGTAESNRQLKAIVDSVSETLKQDGILPLHEEGTADSGWILLDYGSLIVHIFDTFQRDYYQLDKFWEKACIKVRVP